MSKQIHPVWNIFQKMPGVRLELTRFFTNPRILSPVRLPISPPGLSIKTLFFYRKYVTINPMYIIYLR